MVSILIPVFNGEQVIESCLDSVLASTFRDYEILILDDCSIDMSVERIKKYLSRDIKLIRNKRNKGFVKNVIRGIARSGGDIIVLLNMDTVVNENWLEELVRPIYKDPKIGITGSKIYYMDGITIQHAGAYLDDISRSYHIGRGQNNSGQYDSEKEVTYVCGASMAFRREVFNMCNGFDTGYSPAYYEEVDFAARVSKKGFKIMYVPTSILLHHECYSFSQDSMNFFYHISKSRLRFALKTVPLSKLLLDFIPGELMFFKNNHWRNRKILLRAYLYTWINLLEILIKRIMDRGLYYA